MAVRRSGPGNTRDFLLLALRRWYVVVAGLTVTAGTVHLLVTQMPTVYTARTSVTVQRPETNPFQADATSINGVAVILMLRANGGSTPVKTSSPETTLYGEGVFDGSRMRIRDTGGQWATEVAEPLIYVEATGPTSEVVTERVDRLVGTLQTELERLQRELEVPDSAAMFVRVDPDEPSVQQVSGNRNRLTAVAAMLGAAMTALVLYLVDRIAEEMDGWRWQRPSRRTTPKSGSRRVHSPANASSGSLVE